MRGPAFVKTLAWPSLSRRRINARQRELILHSLFVEGPVVDTHTPPAVLFGDKQDRRAVGTRTGPDETLSQEVLDLLLHFVLFSGLKSVWWPTWGFRALLGANLMHNVPFWGTSLWQCVREHIFELIDEFLQLPTDTRVYPLKDLCFPLLNTEELKLLLWACLSSFGLASSLL